MALTFTTGMTMDGNAAAESATNWAISRLAGSGQAPASSLSTDVFRQGAACMSAKVAVANTDAALLYDYYTDHGNAALDLSTGNKHVAIWVQVTTISALRNFDAGGLYVILQSSAETGVTAPTVYSKWTVRGADNYEGGWIRLIIDPTRTPTVTAGGGADLAAIRRIGVGIFLTGSPGTIKAENLFVDAIAWGKPLYAVTGDGATVAAWSDFLADSQAQANGLIEDIGGAVALSCGIRFGSAAQGTTTSFLDDTGKTLIFKRHTYYQAGTSDILDYPNVYVVDGQGAASFRTSIIIGRVVGTGDDRQGVLGGNIFSADTSSITWRVDFQTAKANLSAVRFYGLTLAGAKGGILLDNNAAASESSVISGVFVNCGEIDPGATGNGAELLNCSIIDPLGGTAANRGLRIPATHNIKKISCITSETPTTQHLTHLPDGGSYTVIFDAIKFFGDFSSATLWHGEASAASAAITVSKTGGADPVGAEFDKTGAPPATVDVTASFTHTLTGIVQGSEVTYVRVSDGVELFHVESVGAGGTTTYSHSGGETVDILIVHLDYDPDVSNIYDILLPNGDATLPIKQIIDTTYSNP